MNATRDDGRLVVRAVFRRAWYPIMVIETS
jgi:hypothetical protein